MTVIPHPPGQLTVTIPPPTNLAFDMKDTKFSSISQWPKRHKSGKRREGNERGSRALWMANEEAVGKDRRAQ
jgi:hypothetical protein